MGGGDEVFAFFGTSEPRDGDEEEERFEDEDNEGDRMPLEAAGNDEETWSSGDIGKCGTLLRGGVGEDTRHMGTGKFSSSHSSEVSCTVLFCASLMSIERGNVRSVVVERIADVRRPEGVEKKEEIEDAMEDVLGGGNIKILENFRDIEDNDDGVDVELKDDEDNDEEDGVVEVSLEWGSSSVWSSAME